MNKKGIVVDTNLVFSALLAKESAITDIIFDNNFIIYSPNFLFVEIFMQ